MAKGIVQQVVFNVPKMSKAGKSYNVMQLKYVTEKGQTKTEDIFENATYANVIKGLAPGDEVDVVYVKNGNFFYGATDWTLSGGFAYTPATHLITKSGGSGE